jgi:hypothetical protein
MVKTTKVCHAAQSEGLGFVLVHQDNFFIDLYSLSLQIEDQ